MKKFILYFISLFFANFLYAGNPASVKQFINNKNWNFVENKGQLPDENHNPSADIKYYGHQGGVYVYCKPGMISFVLTKVENQNNDQISEATSLPTAVSLHTPNQNSSLSTNRADLVLLNSNSNAQVIATDKQEYCENYYTTGDADKGITNVHTFKTVTYKNVYPHIDMVLKSQGQGMEYSFLVHPGGNVSDITIRWKGFENAKALQNGGFSYSNALGNLEESAPKSFADGVTVESRFVKKDDGYGFKVMGYDKGMELIIDPILLWGTYFGGNNVDNVRRVSTDGSGNVFIAGYTLSTSGIATGGAYQTSYGGTDNAFVAKFNRCGSLLWATYYGGGSSHEANGVAADVSGNAFVTGYRYTGGTGIADAFLAKFNSSGSLLWANYYGGSAYDEGIAVATDGSGNAYITGYTTSTNDIATSGAYKTSNSGGSIPIDAFLAKFSGSGSLLWATYYGGNSYDYGCGVATDGSGNAYITGYTYSTNGIATSGAYQTSYDGGPNINYVGDAFIAKFSSSGSLLWGTYDGNGNYSPFGPGVAADGSGNVFITGNTTSSIGIATNGAYQTSPAGNSDAFLAKFNNNGSLQWATYYGGSGGDGGYGVAVDSSGNAYITGYTSSANGIATNGAYQISFVGSSNAFLAKFNSSGSLQWGTYYGGNIGYGVALDGEDNAYIIGNTGNTSGIVSSGAYQTSPGGGTDAFLAKFNGYDFQIAQAIVSCPGELISIGSIPMTYFKYAWSSSPVGFTSTSPNPVVSPNVSTIYYLTATDTTSGCAIIQQLKVTLDTACKGFLTMQMDTSMNTFDTLRINVSVNNAKNIYSLYARLNFNPDVFKLASSTHGDFLGSNIIYTPAIKNKGYIDFGITKQGKQSGSTGNGIFYSFAIVVQDLNFPTHDLKSLFTLDSIIAYDNIGNNISLHDSGGKIVDVHAHIDVWPGDLNNDKVVDVSDILPIGYFYNKTGPKRTSANLAWKAQSAPFWGNDKTNRNSPGWEVFGDANGDGIIGLADEAAIGLNMTDSHNKQALWSPPTIDQASSTNPTLTAIFPDTAIANSSLPATITIPVNIGSSSVPVSNLLGVSFLLSFNPAYINPSSVSLDFSNSIFGTQGTDYINVADSDFANGKLSIGLTRYNTTPLNTFGNVVNLKCTVPANAPAGFFKLYAKVLSANDQNGNPITINSSVDSTHVYGVKGGIYNSEQMNVPNLMVYPNPFNSSTILQFSLSKPSKVSIELFDVAGKRIGVVEDDNQPKGEYSLAINAEKYHLTSGVYILKFITDDGYIRRQIIKL